MTVRAERPGDGGAVHRVHEAAFGRPEEARLVDALRYSKAWIGGLSWVVTEDEVVVGHALITRVEVDGAPALSLAPVAVLPECQGRGYGSAVVRAVLDAAAATGLPLVVVLGDPGYYARFGFEPASEYNLVAPWPGVGAAYQVLPLPAYNGEPQGHVTYPEEFDELN
ncbi:GNAT family N-acetyltransferase [Longispora albida]|uniref:GNAT family N-acetyltransferase n=1 Tax=Longispora albida TaxID=203523 RepID=UPI00035EE44E|nr:N-acetyltransferase [Longispora albida]